MDHHAQPPDPLGVVADATARADETLDLAARHLDPSLVDVLRILGFDKAVRDRRRGSYLYDARRAAPTSTSTPARASPASATTIPTSARCCRRRSTPTWSTASRSTTRCWPGCSPRRCPTRLPAGLDAVFFASAGAEAVDSAMKFARAATGRPRLLSCDSSFHGVTLGTAVAGRRRVLQGGLRAAAARLRRGFRSAICTASRPSCAKRDVAAFIVEPIQGRQVTLPPDGLPAGGPGAVPPLRHAVRGRRDPDRARAHREVVRARALGARAGLRAGRQGAQRRLHAGRGDGHDAARSSSGRSARSSAPTCTSRRSGATGCRWPPVWRRCGSSSATAWSSTPRASGAVLMDGLAELQGPLRDDQRGPRARADDRDRAGRAELAKVARLNWRLIHLASEGLFPQLIVIPLHRDHGVITMAAGKNDVIKLLPPLTLSESEAGELPDRARRRARRLPRRREQELGRGARHRDRDAHAAARPRRRWPVIGETQFRGKPIDPERDDVCLITGATGFIGGHLAAAAGPRGPSGPLPGARQQRHVAAREARRRDRGRRSDQRRAR